MSRACLSVLDLPRVRAQAVQRETINIIVRPGVVKWNKTLSDHRVSAWLRRITTTWTANPLSRGVHEEPLRGESGCSLITPTVGPGIKPILEAHIPEHAARIHLVWTRDERGEELETSKHDAPRWLSLVVICYRNMRLSTTEAESVTTKYLMAMQHFLTVLSE